MSHRESVGLTPVGGVRGPLAGRGGAHESRGGVTGEVVGYAESGGTVLLRTDLPTSPDPTGVTLVPLEVRPLGARPRPGDAVTEATTITPRGVDADPPHTEKLIAPGEERSSS